MPFELFLEETRLQGPRISFRRNGVRLSAFSAELTSEARELYRRSKNYGDVVQALIDYLCVYNPDHPIHINISRFKGEVMWSTGDPIQLWLKLDVNGHQCRVTYQNELQNELVFLAEDLVVCPHQNQLFQYKAPECIHTMRKQIESQWGNATDDSVFQKDPLICTTSTFQQMRVDNESDTHALTDMAKLPLGIDIMYDQSAMVGLSLVAVSPLGKLMLGKFATAHQKLCPRALSDHLQFSAVMDRVIQTHAFQNDMNPELFQAFDADIITALSNWQLARLQKHPEPPIVLGRINEVWVSGYIDMDQLDEIATYLAFVTDTWGSDTTDVPSMRKSDFHNRLPQIQDWALSRGYELTFSKETVESRRLDLSINGEFDINAPIWSQLTIDGMPDITMDRLNEIRLSDWVFRQNDTTIVISPEIQTQIDALFITEKLVESPKSSRSETPFKMSNMIYYLGLYQAGLQSGIPRQYQAHIAHLLDNTDISETPVPTCLKITPRCYQIAGYQWVLDRFRVELGAVLADEMGLGKTLQAIMCILAVTQQIVTTQSKSPQVLIVVPPSLLYNWQAEVNLVADELSPLIYFGPNRDPNELKTTAVTLTTYDIVRLDLDTFKEINYEMVVFDEVQWVKNIKSHRAVAVRHLSRQFTLCLTGTPLENHVGDYYAILDLAVPGLLGNWPTFQQLYKQYGDQWVSKRTMPFVLRRLKSSILTELPDKIEQTIRLNLTDNQKTMYQGLVQKIQQALTDPNPSMAILTGILRLRQLCITPQLLETADDPTHEKNARDVSPKFNFVLKTLPDLLDGQHSCLIYSQFSQVLDRLGALLTDLNIPFLRIDGTVPMKKRQSLVTEFQESSHPMVMLMTLKTGGVGLNLTRASYVIHLDPWWNPATEDQATDRAHRIGQTQAVTVLKLVMTDSIEERVFQLKTNKQALISNILKKGEGQSLTPLDLNTLISLLE